MIYLGKRVIHKLLKCSNGHIPIYNIPPTPFCLWEFTLVPAVLQCCQVHAQFYKLLAHVWLLCEFRDELCIPDLVESFFSSYLFVLFRLVIFGLFMFWLGFCLCLRKKKEVN